MSVSTYSIIMAILWFSIFSVAFSLLRRKNWFISAFNLWVMVLLVAVCIFRVIFAIEVPGAVVIPSKTVYVDVQEFFENALFSIGGLEVTILRLLVCVWGIGAVLLLTRMVVKYILAVRQITALPSTDDERLLGIVSEVCGADSGVRVVKNKFVAVPMMTGLLKPVIFLPEYELPDDAIKSAVLHEWSHFRHKDIWIKLITNFVCCILWWNPLVYYLQRDVEQTLEIKCDRDVISKMDNTQRAEYFGTIVLVQREAKRFAVSSAPPCSVCLVSAKYDRQLVQRFKVGMGYEGASRALPNIALCAVIALVFVGSYAFILQPASYPENTEGMFIVSPENAYLVENSDGTYALYVDGVYAGSIAHVDSEPYSLLKIKEG